MRIKLENIYGLKYHTGTGEPYIDVVIEYTCAKCRTLAEATDRFCRECGESLEQTSHTEHHGFGGEIAHKDFVELLKMKPQEAGALLRESITGRERDG